MSWLPSRLPDRRGRVYVVTGGNAGLGYFTAEQLASTGAHVVLASRDGKRADAAIRSIRARLGRASLDRITVDLSSLESAEAAGRAIADFDRLDGLVLNAGAVTGSRERQESVDGLELVLATNYVGHFALTARAWPILARTPDSRVVGLGSLSTELVRLDPADLMSERRYGFFRAYAFSKHALHGFTLELDRRARAVSAGVAGVLAHPGYAIDGLTPVRPGVVSRGAGDRLYGATTAVGAQGKNRGAASTVRALLDPTVVGGEYVGPEFLTRGRPVLQRPAASSASPEFGAYLWAQSELWTGASFDVTAG
ncbi:SDR family NAD(P)-dependent oxidoreductase [Conyzicola sp.]|uniref:SDR family NAD(P)-dependent oxidoreductase n=1 Tax=Conyzicola sp. TaxID=1969404 RepID=UPI0039891EB3